MACNGSSSEYGWRVLEPGTLARVSRGRQSRARMRIRLGSLQAPVDKSVKNLRRGERETA